MRFVPVFLAFLAVASPAFAAERRPLTVDDLFKFKRVSDPRISPDGKLVAYVVGEPDLAANKVASRLWIAPADGTAPPRQVTNAPQSDRHPRWSPDGRLLLFESGRSGSSQLWVLPPSGEARKLTDISTGAGSAIWSRDGKKIAFVSAVYPEFSDKPFAESDAANKKRMDEIAASPVKAKVFTKLFYRHWDEYTEDKRQHLFVADFDADAVTLGTPKDVTPGDRDAYPTSSTFSTGDDFTFSPDGTHLVYSATPEKDEAWSTDYGLFRVPVAGGKPEPLTADNKAADSGPVFSPDGKRLAYRAQKRAGFEADRWDVVVVDCKPDGSLAGKPKALTGHEFDRSAEEYIWTGDDALLFTAEDNGSLNVYALEVPEGTLKTLSKGGTHSALSWSEAGKSLAYLRSSLDRPADVFVNPASSGPAINVSRANADLLAKLDMPRPESVTVKVEGGQMQMWLLKPPGFNPAKKWPVVYLVHGGPQGAWTDGWSWRWNPQVWAAQGYVIALPNPRGSTGFGQKFVDEISGDWGGKCYDDLMAGVEYVEKLPFVDTNRLASAGASFGGYMMNWFQGHTTKFKTLITHCGVYNFDSMYALTDELWFDEWEHGGPPWLKRESYEKHSPHKFAKDFKTPMLIIHNDLDFRVPVSEGLQLFTTLQRLGVPSKMINFPDEGHWVLKPRNSEYWHKEIFAWLKKYVPPGGN